MSLARYDATVLLAAVTALSAAVAFVAALHLYARCLLQRRIALAEGSPGVVVLHRPPDGYVVEVVGVVEGAGGACGQQAAGLDAKALPVFTWESEQGKGKGKGKEEGGVAAELLGQQCAVCLGEMEDGDLGRLLPACRHVFHVECIDTWLGVSSTCPVCRTAAAAPPAAGVDHGGEVLNSKLLKPKIGTLKGTSGKSSKPLQKWREDNSSLQ